MKKKNFWWVPVLLIPLGYLGAQEAYKVFSATPGFRMDAANGQFRHELNTESGDSLFVLSARGHDGSNYSTADVVSIVMQAAQEFTSTAMGTNILFKTTPKSSTTQATVLTITSDGGLAPYSRTEAQLKVSTPTVVGAIWYDSTNTQFVKSTGTSTSFDYAALSSTNTIAPVGW